MGEGGGERRERKAWQNHSANHVTHPKPSKYEQSVLQGEAIEVFHRCFDLLWYFYGRRRREEFKTALEGALKFFPGIKIKPEQELSFESLVVKRNDVLGVWKSLMYQLLRNLSEYWFHKTGTKKTISVLRISKFWFTTSCRWKGIVTVNKIRAR